MPQIPQLADNRVLRPAEVALALNLISRMDFLRLKAIARLHETPGIEAVAVSLTLPYERALNEGVRIGPGEHFEATNMTYVTPELFTALRIPLLLGRVFNQADGPDSASVAVVNQAFVKRFFKSGEDPLGQHFGLDEPENASTLPSASKYLRRRTESAR